VPVHGVVEMAEIDLANISFERNASGGSSAVIAFAVRPIPSTPCSLDDFEITIRVPGASDPTSAVNEAKVELHKLILRLADDTKHWAT